jgi:hypothetical protein
MSEFDQEDSRKKWPADYGVNPAQLNVGAAEHPASCTTAEKCGAERDCLGQLIEPRSRGVNPACAEQRNARSLSYDKMTLAWFCRAAARLVAIRPGFTRH